MRHEPRTPVIGGNVASELRGKRICQQADLVEITCSFGTHIDLLEQNQIRLLLGKVFSNSVCCLAHIGFTDQTVRPAVVKEVIVRPG